MEKNNRLKFNIKDNRHIFFEIKKTTGCVPRHWHNYFELEIIIGGRGIVTISGVEYDVFPGYCYLLALDDYHSVNTHDELEIMHLSFEDHFLTQEQLERILTKKGEICFVLDAENFEIVKSLFLACKMENEKFGDKSSCFRKIFECLITKVLDSSSSEEKSKEKDNSSPLKLAMLYIHTHFQKAITLDEVANVAKYNTSYFSSAFKNEFGVSFSEYLAKLRIDYAKRLLISTDERINEIGKRSGFFSASAFLQCFKKFENMSPCAYRKKNN